MKKFTRFNGILLSIIMIFTVGTTTVLAEPGEDALSDQQEETAAVPAENGAELQLQDDAEEQKGIESEDGLEADIESEEDLTSQGDAESEVNAAGENPETDEEEDSEESEIQTLSADEDIEYIKLDESLALSYDDRYDLDDLKELPGNVEYVIYQIENEEISSTQVSQGENTGIPDEALLTLNEEDSSEMIATAVGFGTVWLVEKDKEKALKDALDEEEAPDTDDSQDADEQDGSDKIEVYQIDVTVEPATLTLMFLTGQSNMEGYCCNSYDLGATIACENGTVYSTYAPSSDKNGSNITGISSVSACSVDNAGNFVAGSLQGSVASDGTLSAPLNSNGGELIYPLNSLTSEGNGKTGPDSGLAYEWNQKTGDKVWVVNTAYGATSISKWVPGMTCDLISKAVWENVLNTYSAEVGNHYSAGKKLMFWLQGETDCGWDADQYETYFANMYSSMAGYLSLDGFGIIMVRATYTSDNDDDFRTESDLKMTGPRIAQYWLGSGDSKNYSNVYVVSNVNEQWVSNSAVKSYFNKQYGSSFSYPMQGGSQSVPTTVNEVHSDVHYSQIGHNENGITAADGMFNALNNLSAPTSISWKDKDFNSISSLDLNYIDDEAILVGVSNPAYDAKSVTYSSGSSASYDASTGTVKGVKTGKSNITASSNGSTIGKIEVTVGAEKDLSGELGKKTGVYKASDGNWYYVVKGIVQTSYEGVQQNDNGWWYINNGKVDFTYTGFAENTNGWWYIEDGKVTFEKNSVLKDTNKKIDGTDGWWYVVESKVQTSYTGVANYKNSNGWWYVKKGKVDFSANTVAKNNNGWWYVEGGKVIFSYNGFGSNSNGKWYCEDGKVTFKKNSVLKDTTGAIGTKGTWYYVVESKVQTSYTGVANYKNSNGWWYIKNGAVDFSANTVAKNNNGWWYVIGGKVQFGFTGLANYKNSNGWWYIKGGKVDFSHEGVDKNNNGWWYVKDGKVRFSFNGIAKNSNGWWYIKDGKVDFSYNGTVKASGVTYKVTNGKVAR